MCCNTSDNSTNGWYRKENEGNYYLLKAYLAAESNEEKDYLWYARILFMMAMENKYKQSDYDILNLYLKPCVEAYDKAMVNASRVSENEVKNANYEYEKWLYDYNCHIQGDSEASSLIEGFSIDDGFQFHDSKVIDFSNDMYKAYLTLEFDGIKKVFEFTDVYDVEVHLPDMESTWVFDCYCYRPWLGKNCICFDIESYKITCKEIRCK